MKLQLPSVTLFCADCVNVNRAIRVIERCKSLCDFGAVKFLTSLPAEYEHRVEIMPLNSLIAYSVFMLTNSYKYIDTSHVLVVQRDGFILNPSAWKDEWLNLDYIAPLFVQYDKVGSGGFSLRSKRLMENAAKNTAEWDGTDKHAHEIQDTLDYYEDGVLCLSGRYSGFRFAPLDQAASFAAGGNPNRKYHVERPFGFHGALNKIDHSTGVVSPVCGHIDGNCMCAYEHKMYLKQMGQ